MNFYNEATNTWKLLQCGSIAGYCGGTRWYLTSSEYRDYLLSYLERGSPPEQIARNRMRSVIDSLYSTSKLLKFTSATDLAAIMSEVASEEQRERFFNHHNNDCNVRIGEVVYIAGAARRCIRGTARVPLPAHRTALRTHINYSYRGEWWPGIVDSCSKNLAQMFEARSKAEASAIKTMIPPGEVVQCIATHCTRDIRGRFNMEVYDMLPKECRDDDGLVRQWHEIAESLYACMPIPLFGNPLHGGGFSWASFFYRTDNPETLPTITTGTAKELLE